LVASTDYRKQQTEKKKKSSVSGANKKSVAGDDAAKSKGPSSIHTSPKKTQSPGSGPSATITIDSDDN